MSRVHATALIAVLVLSSTGCRSETPSGQSDESSRGAPDRARQREIALAAQQDLFDRLSGRLMEVISDEGLAAAIEVCSREAPALATQVAHTHAVAIGRTSFQLRNPSNTPPAWASSLVEQRVADARFVDLPDGALGALLPIRLKPTCLACHGTPDQIPAEVQAALAARYPEDQATGFGADDLRGWFWIEVPWR